MEQLPYRATGVQRQKHNEVLGACAIWTGIQERTAAENARSLS